MVTGNLFFLNPLPTLEVITTALNAFTVALADAANGETDLTHFKNMKRAELVSLMTQLAAYITITTNGNVGALALEQVPVSEA